MYQCIGPLVMDHGSIKTSRILKSLLSIIPLLIQHQNPKMHLWYSLFIAVYCILQSWFCSDSSSCILPICSKHKIYLFIMELTLYECFWKVSTIQSVTFLEQALNYIDRHIIKGCWLTEWMTAAPCRIASHWLSGCKNYLQPLEI